MNKAKLKSYAPQARKDFIAAVTARANLLGLSEKAGKLEVATSQPQGDATVIAGQAWPVKVHSQRQQLIARIQKDGFAQTMEAVAYTWFNRFAALRYMELHDYLGHGHRALSSLEGTLPDILTHAADLAQNGAGNGGLPGLKPALVVEMKLAGNRDGELYSMLLVAQCNALSNVMPFLFERIDDETELLLPDNLLRTDSVIARLVTSIDEDDWKEIEIIGWLYQFYISERKDEVIGNVVESDDIPAATQLFTPNWIVQYMVQNSIGRLWLMANPTSALKARWPYYIQPANQTLAAQAELDALIVTRMNEDGGNLNPESITLLDPACGSGHILVEAYEVLKAIYLERGYQPRAIPRLILEKNLFGLDIDDRAAQMAGFALLMKARVDDRRLFNEPIKLNVLSFQESNGMNVDALSRALQAFTEQGRSQIAATISTGKLDEDDSFPDGSPQRVLCETATTDWVGASLRPAIAALTDTFLNAKTFGSLIQIPKVLNMQLAAVSEKLQRALVSGDLYAQAAAQELWPLVAQAQVLGRQFDSVIANPPYMGGKYLTPLLKDFLKNNYQGYEKDLFSAFIIRDLSLTRASGQLGFMSPFVWMFISSYEKLRQHCLESATLASLVQLEYSGFDGATVPICTFTLGKAHISGFVGSYIRLSDFKGADQQGPKTLEAIGDQSSSWFYNAIPDDFKNIPGSPIAYWISEALRSVFLLPLRLKDIAQPSQALVTGNTDRYIRKWPEVSFSKMGLNILSREESVVVGKKWIPYNKGGEFRNWYGNNEHVVNWENDGRELQTTMHPTGNRVWAHNFVLNYIFKKGIVWSKITSATPCYRLSDDGFLYDDASGVCQVTPGFEFSLIGFLASKVCLMLTKLINPTLNIQPGNLEILPLVDPPGNIDGIVIEIISIFRQDWNNFEVSWEFSQHPILMDGVKTKWLSLSWDALKIHNEKNFSRAKYLEIENNRAFIDAYGLQGELSPEVLDSQITLSLADREKDCQRLMSYAIGCIMGRYSLDVPGLIYAHAGNIGFDTSRYDSFPADADGIVPVTDELWFADEAASRIREFLLVVWGADTLAENMEWLAESLGTKAGETADETIRRYLADKFYKDHVQTYKKRPIYWLFSSGKQGAFQALVYLHRYNEGTLSRMRAEYVVPLTGKIQSRIDMLQKDATAAASTGSRNKLAKEVEKLKKKHVELLAYDEQLRHYADMRITLDLDDGVKVNYGRFGNLLAEVKAVTGGASDD